MATVKENYRKSQGASRQMRLGYVVTDCENESIAITETIGKSHVVLPDPTLFPLTPLNRRWGRWDCNFEEVQLPDPARTAPTAQYRTVMDYRTRYICPKVSFDWATQSQTIYEGVGTPKTITRTGQDINAEIGINEVRQSGNYTVQGTEKAFPVARLQITWQPWTVDEATKMSYQLDEAKTAELGEPVYWATSTAADAEDMIARLGSYVGKVHAGRQSDIQQNGLPANPDDYLSADWDIIDGNKFCAFLPGEVLFSSFQANRLSETLPIWEFKLEFDCRRNPVGRELAIDGIYLQPVEAWDYVWGGRKTTPEKTSDGSYDFHYNRYQFLRREKLYETADLNELFHTNDDNLVFQCQFFEHLPSRLTDPITPPPP